MHSKCGSHTPGGGPAMKWQVRPPTVDQYSVELTQWFDVKPPVQPPKQLRSTRQPESFREHPLLLELPPEGVSVWTHVIGSIVEVIE